MDFYYNEISSKIFIYILAFLLIAFPVYSMADNDAIPSKFAAGATLSPVLKYPAGVTASPDFHPLPVSPISNTETLNKNALPETSADILRDLTGNKSISLNLTDAFGPADIQTPLHMEEAVAFALKNNFEVQAANEKSEGAAWDKWGAYSEYFPNAQISADIGPEKSDPASFNDLLGNRVLNNLHKRKDSSLIITQPLIDLGIISDILSGKDKQKMARTDQTDIREGVAYDTISVYLDLLQSSIAVRLSDNYISYLNDLMQRMQARVQGGGATIADLDRIHGRSTAAASARIEALGQYESNLAEFKRLTKIMPGQLVIPFVLAPAIPGTMSDALEKALKSNPAYLSSLEKIDLAKDDKNKAFSGLAPRISAQYANSYSYNAGGAAEGNPVDGLYPTQRTQTVLLIAQWDLGGPSVMGGMSGIHKEREMSLRALDVRSRIEQGIQTGYAAINAAHQREAVLRNSVEDDAYVVQSFEKQYQVGGRSLFDMLDSYEQLYNARLNLMHVVIAEAKASYDVRRQMGELQQSILESEAP